MYDFFPITQPNVYNRLGLTERYGEYNSGEPKYYNYPKKRKPQNISCDKE